MRSMAPFDEHDRVTDTKALNQLDLLPQHPHFQHGKHWQHGASSAFVQTPQSERIMSAMHVLQRSPLSISTAPHSCPGRCHVAACSAASSSAAACQRDAASKRRTQHGSYAAALHAERSAPLCRSASISAANPASAAPAGTNDDTSLGSAGWNQFADAASGMAVLMNVLTLANHAKSVRCSSNVAAGIASLLARSHVSAG